MDRATIDRALSSDDAELRRQAVLAIAASGDPELAPQLLTALGDGDWRVREEAVNAGRALAESFGLIRRLIDAVCQGSNVGLRNAALELLGQLGSAAVTGLVAALPRVDEGSRKFVIEALARSGDPGVVDTLVEATESEDSNLVAAAIEALAVLGGSQAEAALLRRLRSSDSFERLAAVDALNRLGAVIPWAHLEPLLSDRLVFRVALAAAGRTRHPEAIHHALRALPDRSERLVVAAIHVLCELTEVPALQTELSERLRRAADPAREALRRIARGGDERAVAAAAQLLCLARDVAVYDVIVELASRDSLPPAAIEALCAWGMEAVRGIFAVYADGRTRHSATALELASDLADRLCRDSRGSTFDPEFIGELRQALRAQLQSTEPAMLISAARSLGLWGEPEDAGRLLLHTGSADAAVRRACRGALETLARRDPGAVESALSNVDLEGPGGAELTALVASLGGEAALPRLHTALLADDPETRCAAIAGLAMLGGSSAAELVARSLTDESPQVQAEAARALGELRDEQGNAPGVEALLLALSRALPDVQAEAARALGRCNDARALPRLRALLPEAPAQVRIAAIEALRALGDERLGDDLVDVLGAEDPEVVKAALSALASADGARGLSRVAIALEHRAWDVRCLAAGLLQGTRDDALLGLVAQRLEHEQDPLVRQALEETLWMARGKTP